MTLQDYTYAHHSGTNGRTLLLLHGVGGDENDMTQIGQLIDPDASRLSPKGKVTIDGHARYFTRRADASFDPIEVTRETDDLIKFINKASAQHQFTNDQVVAIGYSNGANMIASLMAKHPGLIRKAILFRGMLPIDFIENPNLHGVDILLINGEADPIMDRRRVEQLDDFLTKHGATVSLSWIAAGHQLSSDDIAIAAKWLAPKSS